MKRMKIRRADACGDCGTELAAGSEAWWDATAKVVRCVPCVESVGDAAAETDPDGAGEAGPSPVAVAADGTDEAIEPVEAAESTPAAQESQAGASALREYERRSSRERAKQEQKVADDLAWRRDAIERRPVIGRLAAAVTPRPTIGPETQATTAWKVGAEGERRVAEVLTDVKGIEVLHDRRVPGSRANIDHLVVGPAGVFVIDAKKYKEGSAVEARDLGGFLRSDVRLYVGGRDRTKLVEGVLGQIEVVRAALGPSFDGVPIRGVLCFIGSMWGLPKRVRKVRGVTAVWPKGLPRLVTAKGPHAASTEKIAGHLRDALPPAT